MTNSTLPDARRLLIFAVGLPAAVVVVDHLTWMDHGWITGYESRRTFFLGWLAAKSALLAWTAGKVFGSTPWGWGVFLWSMALIDLQVLAASSDPTAHATAPTHVAVDEYKYPLVSAHFGLLIVWCVLGATSFARRLVVLLVGCATAIYLCRALNNDNYWWGEEALIAVQSSAIGLLAMLALSLRLTGFRLVFVESQGGTTAGDRPFQFGVKHMLIWTAAVVPLLLVAKGLDVAVFGRFTSFEVYPAALICGCIILVTTATIWATLGDKLAAVRWLAWLSAAFGSGFFVQRQAEQWNAVYGRWPTGRFIGIAIEMGQEERWGGWFALTAALLAAMLLFLRACGYRLVKPPTVAT